MNNNHFDDNLKHEPSGYYGNLPSIVRRDTDIPDFAKVLYSEISALTNQRGYCWASNSYLGLVLGKDKVTISRTIAILLDKRYISILIDQKNGNKRYIFCEADQRVQEYTKSKIDVNDPIYEIVNRGVLTKTTIGINTDVNHKQIIEIDNYNTVDLKVDGAGKEGSNPIANTKKEIPAPAQPIANTKKEKTDAAPAIIALLNEVTGRSFRPSDSSLRPIRARLREGFTMDDFSAVIRLKNAQWAQRADMRAYLRPETLFGNKFDAYLQEAKALQATKIPVAEGETDEYRKYLRWCETYFTNLGANFVLDERTHHDLTKGKASANHRALLPKNALSALFKDAHRICNEEVARNGASKGVKAIYVQLINQAIK